MHSNTAYNHAKRLQSRVQSIWSLAHASGSPHSLILERIKNEVYSDSAWVRMPSWAQNMVTATNSAKLDEATKYRTIWAFETLDGKIVVWDDLSEQDRAQYLSGKTGQRYWLKPNFQKARIIDGTLTETFEVTNKVF